MRRQRNELPRYAWTAITVSCILGFPRAFNRRYGTYQCHASMYTNLKTNCFHGAGRPRRSVYMITKIQFLEYQAYLAAMTLLANIQLSFSKSTLKKIIVLFGDADKGKTQSLMELGCRLSIPLNGIATKNVRIILHPIINGVSRTLFLSTYGDTVKDVMNNILFYNKQVPSGCQIYEVKNGKVIQLPTIVDNPDYCIGASRVEEMHWNLYELFANKVSPISPKPIMVHKVGTIPKPSKGTLTLDDLNTIDTILKEL